MSKISRMLNRSMLIARSTPFAFRSQAIFESTFARSPTRRPRRFLFSQGTQIHPRKRQRCCRRSFDTPASIACLQSQWGLHSGRYYCAIWNLPVPATRTRKVLGRPVWRYLISLCGHDKRRITSCVTLPVASILVFIAVRRRVAGYLKITRSLNVASET